MTTRAYDTPVDALADGWTFSHPANWECRDVSGYGEYITESPCRRFRARAHEVWIESRNGGAGGVALMYRESDFNTQRKAGGEE